jgi:hypothetical protein
LRYSSFSSPVSILACALACVALVACSAESGLPGGDLEGDATGSDVLGSDGTSGADIDEDDTGGGRDGTSPPPDTGRRDTNSSTPDTGDLLAVGDLCLSDPECASSLCFRFDANIPDGFCSAFCVDNSACPDDGFSCIFLLNSGGDFARVCVPDDLCIDRDEDNYGYGPACLGVDCDDTNGRIAPGLDEVCDSIDNDCDGLTDENPVGAGIACDTGFTGECSSGRNICQDGLLTCVADRIAQAEFCDNEDNDCDGQIDEGADGEPLSEVCYAGAPETRGVGACVPGLRSCGSGILSDCIGQVLPTPETCNGVDDDCDGLIDEGASGAGIGCTTGLPGVCATGVTACVDGGIVCEESVEVGARAELCNGVDDDCDGTTDNGFAGLGTPCQSGQGVCRRPGVVICASDTSAVPVCDAVAGTPTGAETCDYNDDDCDGQVDEGFRQGDGRYVSVAHCGACGVDCNLRWIGGPATYHVIPGCAADGATASCNFTCEAGWVDADGVADNGCELRPESDTVYVASPSNGGSDAGGCGTWDVPCGSIAGGITVANGRGAARLRVSTGLYRENVTVQNGLSILGGHSATNWQRNPDIFVSTIRGQDAGSGPDRVTVNASSITNATEFSGFTIVGINARPGGNSIGIQMLNSNQNLVIRDNDISAGSGGNGTGGTPGSQGSIGTAGAGGIGNVSTSCSSATRSGGNGGSRSCSGVSVNGGRGGNSERPQSVYNGSTFSGTANGAGVAGANGGGAGGYGGRSFMGVGTTCYFGGNPGDAGVGTSGSAGNDGPGGGGAASTTGSVDGSLVWRGAAGIAGANGSPGSGGGGGGTGPGVEVNNSSFNETGVCEFAPSGGGGGSGGCQGNAGSGGSAGGGSFAVFIGFAGAGPSGPGQMPTMEDNVMLRGEGGRGGDGGNGGGGGEGGAGGPGGVVTNNTTYGFCLIGGAPGGTGGRGGHGGGAGGGAGGVSYDMYLHNTNGHEPDYRAANSFVLAGSVTTGGSGGVGGNSSNTSVGPGGAGSSGASGRLRAVP